MIELLPAYMTRFAGYGDARAPLWFVGMEEGGGRDLTELATRVETWAARGRHALEDLATYHQAIGFPRHFAPPFPLQRTWAPLIRMLQAWRGASTDHASLRRVQATELGAHGGAAALVELLPLPAAHTGAWPYAALAPAFPTLADRAQYRAAYEPARLAMLRALIETAAPPAIVCYGLAYRDAWAALAGAPLEPITISGRTCYVRESATRVVLAVPHPVAHGGTSRFWEAVGARLRASIA